MVQVSLPGYPEARSSLAVYRQKRSILKLAGKDVLDFLHRMSTNELRDLPAGGNRRTVLINEKGRIVDLVTVVRMGESVTLIGSPGNGSGLAAWLERFIIMEDVRMTDTADEIELTRFAGPGSVPIVAEGGRVPSATVAIREDLGSIPAFLLLGEADLSGLPRIDHNTYETVRIEEGLPAFGSELTPDFNPLEAGLIDCISFSKGCYIGQEVIARLDTYKKLQKILSVIAFDGYAGSTLSPGKLLHDGIDAGIVTSTIYSPASEGWIGLGYRRLKANSGDLILQQSDEGRGVKARIVSELPANYESYEITAG